MPEIAVTWLSNLAFDTARYVLVAIPAFLIFWKWKRERFRPRLIARDFAPPKHARRELRYSASTAVIFSSVGLLVWLGDRAGVLRIYEDPDAYGWPYFALSLGVLIVLHDAYFYWTHRAMHHRLLFRYVHRVHHLSTNPSPLAAYAFAPAEALVNAAFVPLVLLVLPVSRLAMFVFLAVMIVRNVVSHLGIELLPRWFVRNRVTAHLITTTHHAQHHKKPGGNYGLYFMWWDRLMGTAHHDYEQVFSEVADRSSRASREVSSGA